MCNTCTIILCYALTKQETNSKNILFLPVISTSAVSTPATTIVEANTTFPKLDPKPQLSNDSSAAVASVADAMAASNIDPSELQKRTEFLKAQRDKLLAMKKAEREKQLAEVEQEQMRSRPKSAKAARSAMSRTNVAAASNMDPETLKARLALAEKLKQEVIGAHIE